MTDERLFNLHHPYIPQFISFFLCSLPSPMFCSTRSLLTSSSLHSPPYPHRQCFQSYLHPQFSVSTFQLFASIFLNSIFSSPQRSPRILLEPSFVSTTQILISVERRISCKSQWFVLCLNVLFTQRVNCSLQYLAYLPLYCPLLVFLITLIPYSSDYPSRTCIY